MSEVKKFLGWRVVGAAFGLQFIQAGLLHQAFGAYVATLAVEKGWSKTALSGGAALQSLESAILGPILGWICDRFGPQGVIRAGVLIFGAGFMALSQIETLAGFYASVVLIALGSSLCGYFPTTVAVVQWFEKQRARALSTMSLGLALGGVAVPLVAVAMQNLGWRTTAFSSGVLIIILGWPLAARILRSPEHYGQTVDGHAAVVTVAPAPSAKSIASVGGGTGAVPVPAAVHLPAPSVPTPTVQREFTAREAMRTRAFWLLSLGHGFALLVVSAVNVHAISHMKLGLGYTVSQASLVITLMTVFQLIGVLVGMSIGDRFQKRYVAALCMLMHAIGLLALTYAFNVTMLVMFAIFHGVAWGLRGPFMQAIRADYFGRRAIGMILGISSVIIALGQIGGPMLAGAMADVTGDYRIGLTIIALVAAFGSMMFMWAKQPELPPRLTTANSAQ